MARQALVALSASPLEVMVYLGGEVFVREITPWVQAYAERNGVRVQAIGSLEDFVKEAPTRLVVVGQEGEISEVYLELKALFNASLYITRSLSYFCEILHPAGGKANALAWLCEWGGISPQEAIAFGNGLDDVDMLRWAHLGVAMEGAPPEVLEVANRVALISGHGPDPQFSKLLQRQTQIGVLGEWVQG